MRHCGGSKYTVTSADSFDIEPVSIRVMVGAPGAETALHIRLIKIIRSVTINGLKVFVTENYIKELE